METTVRTSALIWGEIGSFCNVSNRVTGVVYGRTHFGCCSEKSLKRLRRESWETSEGQQAEEGCRLPVGAMPAVSELRFWADLCLKAEPTALFC